jgi:hypothetical protein
VTVSMRQGIGAPLVLLRFRPVWTYIDGIREFGRFFCEQTFEDADLASRAQMVLQEALENAVKYSAGENGELEVSIGSDGEQLAINCVSRPDPQHLKTLQEELEQLRTLDPEAAYIAAFQRAAKEPEAASRLGLARMRYEGKFELDLAEHDDGRVRITAVSKL